MQPPHQHSRINLAELQAQLVRKLGPARSKQYFGYLNRLLSLKLNKVEFNKICQGVVGRENIPLHNQFIRAILRNACTAKVPPSSNEAALLKAGRAFENKDSPNNVYQQNGSHLAINQPPIPGDLSNGDVLPPVSPKKARTGTRDRRIGDRRSALGPNGTTNIVSQQLSTTDCVDYGVVLEKGESIQPDIQRTVQHNQGNKQQTKNTTELLANHSVRFSTISPADSVSVHSKDQKELLVKEDAKEVPARKLLHPPLGIPLCVASAGGARRALPLAGSINVGSLFNTGGLLDTTTLRERMEQIAATQGIEGVSLDSANILHNGLDAYLKGLIKSSLDLAGARAGHEPANFESHKHQALLKHVNGIRLDHSHMQSRSRPSDIMNKQTPDCPISLLDFKVAMEMNPKQLGEDWPILLEKICTRAFDEEM